jgi:hypothetical protein
VTPLLAAPLLAPLLRASTTLTPTPSPFGPGGDGPASPVPLWLGVTLGIVVVVASFVVLLPGVRRGLDRISSHRPRRFRD